MTELATVQRAFLGQVLGETVARDADEARRMAIYRNAYCATLRGALRKTHRRCAAWLGDIRFDEIAVAYVEANPSPFRNLRDYGAGFADFLAVRCPDDLDIAELAALDWAIDAVFDGPDAQALGIAEIGALATEDWIARQLALHPAASLVEATHNLAPVWQALEREDVPPDMAPLGRRATLLVWRMDGRPHFRTLEPDEDVALRLASSGADFSEICERLGEMLGADAAAVRAAEMLRVWLDEGVLCWA